MMMFPCSWDFNKMNKRFICKLRNAEPKVVHVDQGSDYKITFLANNFEAFIKGLYKEKN